MKAIFIATILSAGLLTNPAAASNSLFQYANAELGNSALATLDGDSNRLAIIQEFDGGGLGNVLAITVTGDRNGGPLGAAFGGLPAMAGLVPGHLIQSGYANSMTIAVTGSGNLFAAAQVGSRNMLTASVIGNNNQAAVSQSGSGNAVAFTQNGTGNVLTVIQRSY